MTRLADLTTLHLGGPAREVVACTDSGALVAGVRRADDTGRPVLVLGGGSNVVVADEGFGGTVLRVLTSGIERRTVDDRIILTVEAGEPWDRLVDGCVEEGLAGLECLAGIPGSTGATPIQNVGAYGQEIAQRLHEVIVFDRQAGALRSLSPAQCRFSYRSSALKEQSDRWVVLRVAYALTQSHQSGPIGYAELARQVGVSVGETAPLRNVRDAVLELRRSKGMLLDAHDRDTVSAGSFFLNPTLNAVEWSELLGRVQGRSGQQVTPPAFPAGDGKVKTSAAWLIEHAGFHRGYGSPEGIAISTKHTLALTNRGRGTTAELVALAREIAGSVRRQFGIELKPEPVFVGHAW